MTIAKLDRSLHDADGRLTLPPVLTIEEAAILLFVGRTAAYDAARRGQIPTIKIGRSLRVPRARLLELLGETAVDGTEAI